MLYRMHLRFVLLTVVVNISIILDPHGKVMIVVFVKTSGVTKGDNMLFFLDVSHQLQFSPPYSSAYYLTL